MPLLRAIKGAGCLVGQAGWELPHLARLIRFIAYSAAIGDFSSKRLAWFPHVVQFWRDLRANNSR